jgi:hypothetical protein
MKLLSLLLRRGSRAILLVGALALGVAIASCGSVANKSDGGTGGMSGDGGATGTGGGGGSAGITGSGGASGAPGTGGAPSDGSADTAPPVDGGGNGAKWDVDKWDMAQWN